MFHVFPVKISTWINQDSSGALSPEFLDHAMDMFTPPKK